MTMVTQHKDGAWIGDLDIIFWYANTRKSKAMMQMDNCIKLSNKVDFRLLGYKED